MAASSISLLRAYGDPLERRIFAQADVIYECYLPYAEITVRHVWPHRIGSSVVPEFGAWTEFAHCHYTALVRASTALGLYDRILERCKAAYEGEVDLAALHLDLNTDLASLFLHLASATELLQQAGSVSPGSSLKADWLRPKGSRLDEIGQLPMRYAHSWQVPVFIPEGGLAVQAVKAGASSGVEPWLQYGVNAPDVCDLTLRATSVFMNDMKDGWRRLEEELDIKHPLVADSASVRSGGKHPPTSYLPLIGEEEESEAEDEEATSEVPASSA